jgi:cellulose synthase/poly-beta-1,6-N-acetylglucosamine synthase-like glycosyltransferase
MFYSIILPTYGRPDEVENFMESMLLQKLKKFEIIVVDGSSDEILYPVIEKYKTSLEIHYFHEKGLKASESRNLGCEKARGDVFVFIDSDCIVPPDYLNKTDAYLEQHLEVDAYGGPDAAHSSFSPFQKAVNYAMTSFFTTGGIRGSKKHIGKFQLRGFNMGVKSTAFFAVGGYSGMQVAEDLDLSMRLQKAGYTTALITDAFVYHKRKSNFYRFFRQLYFHGKGRIDLHLKHGDALKFVHMLPSSFVLYLIAGIVISFLFLPWFYIFLGTLFLYLLCVFFDATIKNKSLLIGFLSIGTSLELLIAYGMGVWRNIFVRMFFKRGKDSQKELLLKQ